MCKTGSGFLTQTDAHMPVTTNSHSQMIADAGIRESGPGQRINIVKYEYIAPDGNFLAPPEEWRFTLDQDILPAWWAEEMGAHEARAFVAMEKWWREKFTENEDGLWHCEGPLYVDGNIHEGLGKLASIGGYFDARSAQSFEGLGKLASIGGDFYVGSDKKRAIVDAILKANAEVPV